MTSKAAVGTIELSSIAAGYQVQDALLKSASVDLLIARTICAGKYIIVIAGSVSNVETAVQTGLETGKDAVVDSLVVSNIHPAVFPAMTQSVVLSPEKIGALGIVETFSASSAMVAADTAAKAANVTIFRLSLAMAMGGKGLLMMTGSVADVEAGVEAAVAGVKEHGLLVNAKVIAGPSKELFTDYI